MGWIRRITLSVLALAGAGVVAWFGGIGPMGPFAGGWLWGATVREPVADWSFTDRIAEVQVQTHVGPVPWSVTTWNLTDGTQLYVPSGDCMRRWTRALLADPDVRVRVDGRVHEMRAVQITDLAEAARLAPVLLEKYFGIRADEASWFGDGRSGCIFRLEPR